MPEKQEIWFDGSHWDTDMWCGLKCKKCRTIITLLADKLSHPERCSGKLVVLIGRRMVRSILYYALEVGSEDVKGPNLPLSLSELEQRFPKLVTKAREQNALLIQQFTAERAEASRRAREAMRLAEITLEAELRRQRSISAKATLKRKPPTVAPGTRREYGYGKQSWKRLGS